ncbi:SDR family NAD(P)-dependent oxidoreductase [Celeribacter indicus]|uniref:Short-chain dehydrogenase/reductase sdr n=1 Tax=Celeribacter indicus TaxID=1208324 RepID=A0A0B5DP00_9RHOB|nr:SDR family oxidoreductase [Celeribacter indicus]AJE44939.1 short-chain dehydrogenase/reductase sdr [Celeribacter indicus]SDW96778.1 NAD(P)-dependent dehydrogenase, short-chain alcohol dehydrogenase family [Celeribacter indicus]
MTYKLEGRTAIVTGAGSGIGLATTKRFLEEGAQVVAADLDISAIAELDGTVTAVEVDLRTDGAERMTEAALDMSGQIDAMVCCAGVAPTREGLASTLDEDVKNTFDVNVLGIMRCARAVTPHMVSKGKGSIVAIASDFGRMPEPLFYDYCMSKAAVLSFMKSLSIEFGPQGIRANCVSPGATRTPIWEKPGGFIDLLAKLYGGMDRDKVVDHFAKEHKKFALQRIGEPEEIAEVAVFLSSDRASFVTGSDYWVNGGSIPVY